MNWSALSTLAASRPATKKARRLSIGVAATITLMATAQLYMYERFPDIIGMLWQTDGIASAHVLAASIVVSEVFAVPFLLSMKVSPAIRLVSMLSGWFVGVVWLLIASWQLNTAGSTVGLFGAAVMFPEKWIVVMAALILAGSIGCASYGMKPAKRKILS